MSKLLILLVVSLLYVASLASVAFRTSVTYESVTIFSESWEGYKVLTLGWMAVIDGSIAWYANIFLVLSSATLRKNNRYSLIFSAIGLLIALSSLCYKKVWLDEAFAPYANIVAWGAGYYLWLSCFLVLLAASAVAVYKERSGSTLRAEADQSDSRP